MRVKICGVTRGADAARAAYLGAWAVGMIFVPKTPRFLTLARARRVRAAIPKGVLAVGVFRDPSREELLTTVRELRLNAVQIYGKVPTGLRVPAFVAGPSKPGPLDYVFLEPERTDADRRAGRGPSAKARTAVWKKAAGIRKRGKRVILAGGLTPENAAEAAAAAKPWALDVSSGVESRPGVKSAARLKAFFAAVPR
ncbi:MAG TPA: phosphoribosylanthranilate isomerase [Elusimicrobiota bacterium]|nr:phosphoribosylanthranilate isomerase [Elusimicrobiota bacterium]